MLHDNPGTTGPRRPVDDATDPPEVPGGMGPARFDDMAVDYFDDGGVDCWWVDRGDGNVQLLGILIRTAARYHSNQLNGVNAAECGVVAVVGSLLVAYGGEV